MSEHPQTFLARVLGGEASPNDIDNYIDAWHQNPRGQHLHSSLLSE